MKFGVNSCEGRYKSIDVHFTNACQNKCDHCIDHDSFKVDGARNPKKILDSILLLKDQAESVLFLGGEPCLYLDELIAVCEEIRAKTWLQIYVTTSLPKICYDEIDKFNYLISLVDGINFSIQHYEQEVAELILKHKYNYPRHELLLAIERKDKVRICCNLVKGFMEYKSDICILLLKLRSIGYENFKLAELQNAPDKYVSYEKVMGIKMPSPYSEGCQTEENIYAFGENVKVTIKRSCFAVEPTKSASFKDLIKVILRKIKNTKDHFFSVVFEDGTIKNSWS